MKRGDVIGCKRVVRVREEGDHVGQVRIRVRVECVDCGRWSAWTSPWSVREGSCRCRNGARPVLSAAHRRDVVERVMRGEQRADVAAIYGVSRSTVHRIMRAERAEVE